LKDGELTAGDVSITVKGQADPGSNYQADGFLADESTVLPPELEMPLADGELVASSTMFMLPVSTVESWA